MTATVTPLTPRLVGAPPQIGDMPYRLHTIRPRPDETAYREWLIEEQLSRFIDIHDDIDAAVAALLDWNPRLDTQAVAFLVELSDAAHRADITGTRAEFDDAVDDYAWQLQVVARLAVAP